MTCFDRNYVSIQNLKEKISVQMIMKYFLTSKLPITLRANLILILINAFIDIKPRTKKIVPLFTKKIKFGKNKNNKNNFGLSSSGILNLNEPEEKVKNYLLYKL